MPYPCRKGDFVDSFFPFGENPRVPGPTRHIAYVHGLARLRDELRAVLVFTTTSERMIGAIPKGLGISIPAASSLAMGMRNGFTIDVHRIAIVPLELPWFPEIAKADFVIGHASDYLQNAVSKRIAEMQTRTPNPVMRMGPCPR